MTYAGGPSGVGASRFLSLGLVALAAAAGGSALGVAFLWAPALLAPFPAGWEIPAIMFAVSLPFTLAGAALATVLALIWRDSLSDRLSDYFGIVLLAIPIGAAMPTPWLGGAGAFFGAIFGPLTAASWSLLYSRFALPAEMRGFGHG